MTEATKNDKAWVELFNTHNILEKINTHGIYEIDAGTINQVREARLMAKFDHFTNLPSIFRDNGLAILPISRSRYTIGPFEAYTKIKYDHSIKNHLMSSPSHLESIQYNDLYSESTALHFAYLAGIIDDLIGEKTYFTISGRMSTNQFDFKIKNKTAGFQPITVLNSQCEIDGGFESQRALIIVEAKNYEVEDFLVRQLYYPYRLWRNKLPKQIIPVFMTFSNDIFSFFIYQFEQPAIYNSLTLITQKNYLIASESIQLSDIHQIFLQAKINPEPKAPFPQADKFERILDLLGLLFNNDLAKEDITRNYQFDIRQTDYYTNAAIYLSLVSKYTNSITGDISYALTDYCRGIMDRNYKAKYLSFVKCILAHEVFYKVLEKYFELEYAPKKELICEIMRASNIYNVSPESAKTIERRAQTVIGWINWILSLQNQI
jgi:hypothetical protein